MVVGLGCRTATTGLYQPLPSVDPALDLVGLFEEFEASFDPALESAAFEGFDDLPMFHLLPDAPATGADRPHPTSGLRHFLRDNSPSVK